MIKKPTTDVSVSFESGNGDVTASHKIPATTLSLLYGEAMETAKKLSGGEPRNLIIMNQFRSKIADYLTISLDDLAEETVYLIAGEMEAKINDLKKTCIITDVSPS